MCKPFSAGKMLAAIVTVAALVQAGGNLSAQDATNHPTNSTETTQPRHHYAHRNSAYADHRAITEFKASELMGMNVRGKSGEDKIGSIKDLMIRSNGRIVYAAVGFGGFLGIGDKLFAVPINAINFVKDDDGSYARIDVTEETLKQRKGFDKDNWPSQADRSFLTNGGRSAAVPESTNVNR
jgi:PRC-barrel domain